MKKKKALIISGIVAVILVAAGWAAVHFGISFVFDKYILKTALSSIAEKDFETTEETEQLTNPADKEPDGEKEQENDNAQISGAEETKKKLSNTEIINRVLKSSELTNKMASMVPYEDKKRIISIVLSNFSKDEITDIKRNIRGGITAEYKAKMISEARSRLTGEQWQQCLNIAYKYIEQIRPYVE